MANKVDRAVYKNNPNEKEESELGNVRFAKAPVMSGGAGGKPSRSPCNDGINKPMGDGLSKPQTQWTKRS